MGAFFTSVQVFAGESGAATRDGLLAAIRRELGRKLVEVAAEEEGGHSLAVGPAGRWVGVYDEETEEQDPRKLEALAKKLSSAVAGYAVGILVHDSDVLWLVLCHRGKKLDEYDSNPDFFEAASARRRRQVAGRAELWAPLLAPGVTADRLRAVWDEKPTFAEELVAGMAPLLGWDEELTAGGWATLGELERDDLMHLHFAPKRHRPRKAGAPRFQLVAALPEVEVSVGEQLPLHVPVLNSGGATRGVAVEVSGSLFREGIARLEGIHLQLGDAIVAGPWQERPDAAGVFTATFPDAAVGAAERARPGRPSLSGFALILTAVPLREGRGDVRLAVQPLPAPAGAGAGRVEVAVVPPPRRPLRYADLPGGEPLLRQLAREDVLVGLGVLDPTWEAAPERVASALRDWEEDALRHAGSMAVLLVQRGRKAPSAKQLASKSLASDSAWTAALAELPALTGLSALALSVPSSAAEALARPGPGETGCTFSRGWPGAEAADNLATLAFWVDARSLTADGLRQAEERLRAAFDALLERGMLAQAFITRAAHGPGPHALTNVYELACGIQGPFVFRREWSTRWLRGVGDVVWLGPALAARVDPPELERVAALRPVSGGLVLERGPGAPLDDLERALAPILPGRGDAAPFARP